MLTERNPKLIKEYNKYVKKKSFLKGLLKLIGILLLAVLVAAAGLVGWLTLREYSPAAEEEVSVSGQAEETLRPGSSFTIMTWNIGYGALGDNADFFMDGGKMSITADEDRVNTNLAGIKQEIEKDDPDILFLQETDIDSDRSYNINEADILSAAIDNACSTFAYNYVCDYVPYPLPPIGKVESGILTTSKYQIASSVRKSLPNANSWPVSVVYLKRCVDISRIPVSGSDKELVLINFHLEAYDSGETKVEQTAILKNLIEEEIQAGNYVIAGGDFNQTFSGAEGAYPVLDEDFWQAGNIDENLFNGEAFFCYDASNPSCRSLDQPLSGADADNFQYYLIDGFIVSSNIDVQSVETRDLKFVNSDHNPVVMSVTLQ